MLYYAPYTDLQLHAAGVSLFALTHIWRAPMTPRRAYNHLKSNTYSRSDARSFFLLHWPITNHNDHYRRTHG